MSSTSRAWAWTVAAGVGVVEAMKDQGICRWNSVMRSAQQHAKHNMRSLSQTKKLYSQSSVMASAKLKDEKAKQSEESLRTVMKMRNGRLKRCTNQRRFSSNMLHGC
ncbi:hypothetical protein D0Y65_032219 [Glycine soja]|uniref:Wound-responsive family protein n=1 Tax=Glycine soja TaxID=3848 RepID=A0A445ICI8_GLYSO|nr:hypothetical protein D0Y65_032219 [Glycine soja]